LIEPISGAIRYRQEPLPASIRRRYGRLCREIQYVFQNPDASLNPRMTVGRILEQPLDVFFCDDRATRREKVARALESVQLDAGYTARYPDQLSGGERQRVAIARAMIVDPVLLLCDEILSALDVSVQAHIIELLETLKRKNSIAMLFISHDLAVVRTLADRVAVLLNGDLVESGTTEEVFSAPFHPYTLSLLRAVPGSSFGAGEPVANESRAPASSAGGCVFAGRCPARIGPICDTTVPDFKTTGANLRIRCHLDIDQLKREGTRGHPRELAAEAGPA
jgi:peptide/nickel transport system ATP-binding protein